MDSAESLLCEVTPLLECSLTLKSAEELFFGEHLLHGHYSNIAPSSSKEADSIAKPHGKEHKKNKKDKGDKGAQKGRQDGLEAAISDAKKTIQNALHGEAGNRGDMAGEIMGLKTEMENLKSENMKLRKCLDELNETVRQILAKVNLGEPSKPAQPAPAKTEVKKSGDGDDFDLFGSSDEEVDEEKERIKQERLKAYAEKKAKKPASVAKSSVILDVKPWDDETDMKVMEEKVREIACDGLVWGGSKLIPLAYGLKKLQIICVIEDEKVSVDDLIENIVDNISDHVQSVDIVAFNKI